ncbi:MAG: efflux RND transporter periplasmic adaptor subunit [Kofleriaceae bacterium]|nr:efflux RND transporter periplasmic adaptor subunit [Kofleriaceae bacterium]
MRGSSIVLIMALAACNKKGGDAEAHKAPPAPPVNASVITVQEAEAPQTLTLTGLIAADQRAEVTADTQGKVLAVMVERGQRVKMGDPVVRLDVRNAALSAREAQANLASARAQKSLAEEECKRAQTLLDKGAITRSEYDRQMTQCTSALQSVSAAQARTEMIAKSVADGLVRAPFEGMVAEKNVTPGEWVAPGRSLFTLVDDDPLKIELSVPEQAVRAIQKGQKVAVSAVAVPCATFSATVTRIGAEIGRTRSLIVEATIDKNGATPVDTPACKEQPTQQTELVPGMFAEANVQIGTVKRPVVPTTAVARRGKTWHAFVVKNGEAEDRVVQTAPSGAVGTIAIVRGLAAGEQIVGAVTPEVVDGAVISSGGAAPAAAKPVDVKPSATDTKPSTPPAAPAAGSAKK